MASATPPPAEIPSVHGDVLYEVVNGQVLEKPAMGSYETAIASFLVEGLGHFARTHRLGRVVGEMLFRIDPVRNLQRRPDVAFVSNERWPFNRRIPREPVWDMVPDLAVEVISPTNSADEVQKKVHEYFRAGVRRVWVVYPGTFEIFVYESTKVIHVLQLGDELDGAPLLPGFVLPVKSLFEDEPE
jgi:Uma2 family endonuclease